MTPEEVMGQLTTTVDTMLADGAPSEQRPGVVYKIYEGDATENIPRPTVERDTMAEADGLGTHIKVSFDYEDAEITDPSHRYHGEDYEWRDKYDTRAQSFQRNGEQEPYTDPSGEVRIRASDLTHRGKTVFNKMSVREINSLEVEDKFQLLRLAERLRERYEERTTPRSQLREEIRHGIAERQKETKDQPEPTTTRRKFGRTTLNKFTSLFKRSKQK